MAVFSLNSTTGGSVVEAEAITPRDAAVSLKDEFNISVGGDVETGDM